MSDIVGMQLEDLAGKAFEAGKTVARVCVNRGDHRLPTLAAIPPYGPGPISLTRALKYGRGDGDVTLEELATVKQAWERGRDEIWAHRYDHMRN